MPPDASSVLDTLRAIARTATARQPSEDERNEKYKKPPERHRRAGLIRFLCLFRCPRTLTASATRRASGLPDMP